MGLINTNYKVLNTTTTAYAAISKLVIEGASGYAIFTISDVRENAIRGNGIKNVRIDFNVSRNENPFITAYNAAKTEIHTITNMVNGELVEVEEKGTLNDWKDNIV